MMIRWSTHTVYPKTYAHGFCFAVLCCGYTLTDFPISIRLTSLALWQSNDCPSASKATLMNMDKYFIWIHYERLHNHHKAKHNKTVCIFLGIYCILTIIQIEINKLIAKPHILHKRPFEKIPIYYIKDHWENTTNLRHTLDRVYITSIWYDEWCRRILVVMIIPSHNVQTSEYGNSESEIAFCKWCRYLIWYIAGILFVDINMLICTICSCRVCSFLLSGS